MKLTQKRLKEVLDYDRETGIFVWSKDRGQRTKKGDVAGHYRTDGYIRVSIDGKLYLAHRIAWLYVYGYLPENQIDHINRIKYDNNIDNLREVSQSCNMRNIGNTANNKSGVRGVCYSVTKDRWKAYIGVNCTYIELGSFIKKIEAVKARWAAEKKYDFPNCCSKSTAYQYLKEKGLI